MQVKITPIEGLLVLQPTVYGDERGFFFESFNAKTFADLTGINTPFVQDNHSKSSQGVLRGLHFQTQPHEQGKLVRVTQGAVWDVAVDIRPQSATRGQWYGLELSAENKTQLWIPPGFAHGFLTLSGTAEFLYKTTDYYAPSHEQCMMWNDTWLNINWPLDKITGLPLVSAKDQLGHKYVSLF